MEFGEKNILKLLLKYSLPAVIAMLTNGLYSIIDRVFVGQSMGSDAIAGIAIAFPVLMTMVSFMMLVAIGGTALLSIKLGESNRAEAELILGNAFSLLIIISQCITIFGTLAINPLLVAFGASANVLPYARDFLQILLYGCIFQAISFGMNNFIRAEGNPYFAMITMITGSILNMILCPLFIYVFGWGIKGSALSSVVAQAVACGLVLYYYFSGKSNLKIKLKNLLPKKHIFIGIVSIGLAPFVLQSAQSAVSLVMNKSLVIYGGDVAVSSMGVVSSILMLILLPVFGINQGIQPIFGFNYGAQKYKRVLEAFKIGSIIATSIITFGYLIIQFGTTFIISLFVKDDPALVALGTKMLKTFSIFLPIIGFQLVSSTYFQSIGKPVQSAILSLSRNVLFLIPLLLILPKYYHIDGLIYAGPISDILSAVLALVLISKELKTLKNKSLEIQNGFEI